MKSTTEMMNYKGTDDINFFNIGENYYPINYANNLSVVTFTVVHVQVM